MKKRTEGSVVLFLVYLMTASPYFFSLIQLSKVLSVVKEFYAASTLVSCSRLGLSTIRDEKSFRPLFLFNRNVRTRLCKIFPF
uniref:Uncharacterized protein n=1 Tax=Rhizophora mucronata TaxID=61149 RepID=A0A2P2PRK0_RHIMU